MLVKSIVTLCFTFSMAFSAFSAIDDNLRQAPERLKAAVKSKIDCFKGCLESCVKENKDNKEKKTAVSECMTMCNKDKCHKNAAQ